MQNRLFLIALCYVLIGCGGGSDKQSEKQELSVPLENLNKNTQDITSSVANTTLKIDEAAKEAIQKTEDISQKADTENIEKANQKDKDAMQKANETISQTVQKAASAAASSYDLENGKKVFKRCIPCHGAKANLNAVGKSQDISKWNKESITNALKGYKEGTYGGAMKTTMTSLLKVLNQQDITDVASYISTLGE
ncbi:MAG: c-type cytochrome [Campylobacteraceae bacterium]|jgi:cytochrome c553|nr:c-type cytochrome [Campylobacteraceae bacterium]